MAYDHRAIERRWQEYWRREKTFRAVRRPGRPKLYALDMFPYPSGAGLHVGHPEGYTATDIVCRFRRMQGYDVLHPMGWDAFGLPAEQYAIATGTHPRETTRKNIELFRRQLQSLGLAYDWDREVDTTDPGYVRWTQWIFLRLFERGLAFQAELPVNWCPELGTVLANEEVIDGKSERGGHPVVRQPLRQWQLRITAYADRLAQDLEGLDWPETREKQREWIGRSEGALVEFTVEGSPHRVAVYTTRPDTLFGATYLVMAPDHPLTLELASEDRRAAVAAYREAAARKSDLERTALGREKTGVPIGALAVNPVNQRRIPIYTADYVLGAYGTGAIMAVPAHDQRDFEFARRFQLPMEQVVRPVSGDLGPPERWERAFVEEGIAMGSPPIDGLPTAEAKERMLQYLEERGLGRRQVQYRLRDWVFSRQRYWGEPIPIVFPAECAGDPRRGDPVSIDYSRPQPLDDSELPLLLPELDDYRPGDPQGPLARALEWRFFQRDGRWYARETNTMPQWAGSCWYYLRYLDPHNQERLFSEEAYDAWMPVDLYVGGSEHAVLHLLYARFWHKVLFDLGVVKHPEPFLKLVHQGMILGATYRWYEVRDGASGEGGPALAVLAGDDARVVPGEDGGLRLTEGAAEELGVPHEARVEARFGSEGDVEARGDGHYHRELGVRTALVTEKMSKSRGNVVNPDQVIEQYGADCLRVYEMFMGPLEQVKPWQTSGVLGVRRFLERVERLGATVPSEEPAELETRKLLHRTVKKVTEDIQALRFNTAVSALMILTNHLASLPRVPREALEVLVLCLSPFAPHLAEQLWERLGHAPSVSDAPWPSFDPALCEDAEVEIAVQVNGKVRGRVRLSRDAEEAAAREAALADEGVRRALGGAQVARLVYVPGRILNLVAARS